MIIGPFVFQVSHKAGNKSFTFFLSSEYERAQWVETLQALQSALPPLHKIPGQQTPSAPMSTDELQSWITRDIHKSEFGLFSVHSAKIRNQTPSDKDNIKCTVIFAFS